MSLRGKVALLTGASRRPGLGRAIGVAFAHAGANLVLVGHKAREALERNAEEARACGVQVLARLADVTDFSAVQEVVSEATNAFGSVDILVNGAGARGDVSLLDMTPDEWHRVLSVNLDGAFNCTKAVAPGMMSRGCGRIILLGGISGQAGDADRAHVVTAKAGLIGFVKAIAIEFGRYGITANVVSPGLIDTPRPPGAAMDKRRKRIAASPLGRAGSSDDVANACLYLASDRAAFITGQTLSVNGGAYMP